MRFFLAFALCSCISCFGQLRHEMGKLAEGAIPFPEADYVKAFHIKSFKGNYSTKAAGDIIRPTLRACYFEFDREGKLTREYHCAYGDTVWCSYGYTGGNQIEKVRISDKYGGQILYYTFGKWGRILSSELRTFSGVLTDKFEFELDSTCRKSFEKFVYTDLEAGLYKKEFLNALGKVYKDELIYTDKMGRIVHTESQTMNGTSRSSTDFSFDDFGSVKNATHVSENTVRNILRTEYVYDQGGKLLSERHYVSGTYESEKQFVYNSDTHLPDAIIWRQEESNFLTILDFSEVLFY